MIIFSKVKLIGSHFSCNVRNNLVYDVRIVLIKNALTVKSSFLSELPN